MHPPLVAGLGGVGGGAACGVGLTDPAWLVNSAVAAGLGQAGLFPGDPTAFVTAAIVADVTGDTYDDLVVLGSSPSGVPSSLLLASGPASGGVSGRGFFRNALPAAVGPPLVSDLNGDGSLEVLLANGTTGSPQLVGMPLPVVLRSLGVDPKGVLAAVDVGTCTRRPPLQRFRIPFCCPPLLVRAPCRTPLSPLP